MPRERLSMRTIREVLRLRWEAGRSQREIGISCRLGRSTVRDYLLRAEAAGLSWPLPEEMDEEALERLLFPAPPDAVRHRPLPDWAALHQELRRKGMTLGLLWQEYRAAHPDGYGYSQFCVHLPSVGEHLGAGAAPALCGGGEAARGLRRPNGAGGGPPHRGGAPGAGLRGGAGRQQLHLSSKPPGPKGWRTGSARTGAAWNSWVGCRR